MRCMLIRSLKSVLFDSFPLDSGNISLHFTFGIELYTNKSINIHLGWKLWIQYVLKNCEFNMFFNFCMFTDTYLYLFHFLHILSSPLCAYFFIFEEVYTLFGWILSSKHTINYHCQNIEFFGVSRTIAIIYHAFIIKRLE